MKWKILKASYIPSEMNKAADTLSRLGEWKTSQDLFQSLNSQFGPFTVDRFASQHNHHVVKFNAWNIHQDAFKEDWRMDNNYMVPPLGMIPLTLLQIIKNQAKG